MATVAEDQQFVRDAWLYLFGREPDARELREQTAVLQSGVSRADFMKDWEKANPEEAVIRIFREVKGRDPIPQELADLSKGLANGTTTRAETREWLATVYDATPWDPKTTPGTGTGQDDTANEDARAYLEGILNEYDLGSLSGWAWEQIQSGAPPARVLQELRQRPEYKQRFAGLELRRANGYNALDEATYISLERSYRQMMRAAGLQPGFYDSPDDFANLIGKDVSPQELQTRLNDYYLAAVQAPQEVLGELNRLYGIGPQNLISYFIDPDKALPLIQRQWEASKKAGIAVRTAYGQLGISEAERLAALGISDQAAEEGFQFLTQAGELFRKLPGEYTSGGTLTREEQQSAVFGGDANLQQQIRTTQQTRVSQGTGGRAFVVGNQGVTGLGRER